MDSTESLPGLGALLLAVQSHVQFRGTDGLVDSHRFEDWLFQIFTDESLNPNSMRSQHRRIPLLNHELQCLAARSDPTLFRILMAMLGYRFTVETVDDVVPEVARICLRTLACHLQERPVDRVSVLDSVVPQELI